MDVKRLICAFTVIGLVAPGTALALNGNMADGFGMKAKGMAGAATAVTGDTFGGANNPAAMIWAGDRMDIGFDWFRPLRRVERSGSPGGVLNGSAESDSNNFIIPEFGYNKMLSRNMSIGVTAFVHGGGNTNYSDGQIAPGICPAITPARGNMLCGSTRLGVDLMQVVIAPTFAMKVNQNHSFGVSPLIAYQRFKAEGLQSLGNSAISASPGSVTNRGYDAANGVGLRLGWLSKVSDTIALGAAYSTKIRMSEFDKYRGFFANQGELGLPENYNVGVNWNATPALNMALDYQVINYNKVVSLGNPSTNAAQYGSSNSPGNGWSNIQIVKLGLEYQYNKNLALRAGYSWGKNPIQARDVTANIPSPVVVKDHVTFGLTFSAGRDEITVAYMHALKNSVSGTVANAFGGVGTDTITAYQNSLGIAYGIKF